MLPAGGLALPVRRPRRGEPARVVVGWSAPVLGVDWAALGAVPGRRAARSVRQAAAPRAGALPLPVQRSRPGEPERVAAGRLAPVLRVDLAASGVVPGQWAARSVGQAAAPRAGALPLPVQRSRPGEPERVAAGRLAPVLRVDLAASGVVPGQWAARSVGQAAAPRAGALPLPVQRSRPGEPERVAAGRLAPVLRVDLAASGVVPGRRAVWSVGPAAALRASAPPLPVWRSRLGEPERVAVERLAPVQRVDSVASGVVSGRWAARSVALVAALRAGALPSPVRRSRPAEPERVAAGRLAPILRVDLAASGVVPGQWAARSVGQAAAPRAGALPLPV
ncbi:hypothetical protein SAMN05880556_114118 [Azospirillum sp. RU38E]|nr:hypothetical protein SAMN05880556_114118 [Azospirillum sp. RU38E]SNT06618.1 hypothetical protein SAMN05880591_114118 [Azospirillum sp. RU37A]